MCWAGRVPFPLLLPWLLLQLLDEQTWSFNHQKRANCAPPLLLTSANCTWQEESQTALVSPTQLDEALQSALYNYSARALFLFQKGKYHAGQSIEGNVIMLEQCCKHPEVAAVEMG